MFTRVNLTVQTTNGVILADSFLDVILDNTHTLKGGINHNNEAKMAKPTAIWSLGVIKTLKYNKQPWNECDLLPYWTN